MAAGLRRPRTYVARAANRFGVRGRQPERSPQQSSIPDDGPSLDYLFIVTYGRSGSTLLQGLLASIPGYLIRGENGGAVFHLYRFHTRVAAARKDQGPGAEPTSPWYGIGGYPEATAYQEIRRLILTTLIRPEPDSRVVGFKEIRWRQGDLGDYVSFLRKVFPGARFIVNTREHQEVARSKWWAKRPDALPAIAKAEGEMLALVELLGADFFHLHYNDYVDEPQRLRALFDWLSAEFDETRVATVMSRKHGY
ncbi:MAG: sulfotransferase [Actinomycetota bacterium]|nr:sulfotransferase [Actinomycetota bacterium]